MALPLLDTPATYGSTGTTNGPTFTSPNAYTPPAGSNRLTVLFVGVGDTDGAVSSATLGGQTMTARGAASNLGVIWTQAFGFVLNEAGIAAMSGSTLAMAISNPLTVLGYVIFTLSGVDQTTPVASVQTGTGTGTTAAASAAVASSSNGWVLAGLMSDDQALTSAGGSGTPVGNTAVMQSDAILLVQTADGNGGSVNLTWNQVSNNYAVVAFNVNAVAGGAAASRRMMMGVG